MEVATPAAKRKADSLQDTYATLGESGRESTAEEHAAGEHARSITRQGVRVRLRAGQLSRAPAAQAAQRRTTSSTPSPRTLSCRPRTRVRNAFPPANAGTDITGRTEWRGALAGRAVPACGAGSDARASLTEAQLLRRRLAHLQELHGLYKQEFWALAEELRARHGRFLARQPRAGAGAPRPGPGLSGLLVFLQMCCEPVSVEAVGAAGPAAAHRCTVLLQRRRHSDAGGVALTLTQCLRLGRQAPLQSPRRGTRRRCRCGCSCGRGARAARARPHPSPRRRLRRSPPRPRATNPSARRARTTQRRARRAPARPRRPRAVDRLRAPRRPPPAPARAVASRVPPPTWTWMRGRRLRRLRMRTLRTAPRRRRPPCSQASRRGCRCAQRPRRTLRRRRVGRQAAALPVAPRPATRCARTLQAFGLRRQRFF